MYSRYTYASKLKDILQLKYLYEAKYHNMTQTLVNSCLYYV